MAAAQARAEAACARASFINKETTLRLEKVHMESTLMALEQEKEAAALLAEARVFEEAEEVTFDGSQKTISINLPAVDSKEHTSNYREQHFQTQVHQLLPPSPLPHQSCAKQESEAYQVQEGSEPCLPSLSFYGERFNDRPFLNAKAELNLSLTEDLDLLMKWFGLQSAEYVKRIQAVPIRYPDIGAFHTRSDRTDKRQGPAKFSITTHKTEMAQMDDASATSTFTKKLADVEKPH
ncbi:hypothetical protein MHYP_G00269160 [Metynnis hypsauchen]